MKTVEEFKAYYEKDLRPTLEILEGERKSSLRNASIACGLIAVVVLGAVGTILASGGPPMFALVLAGIGAALAFGALQLFTRGFKSQFKDSIIRPIIAYVSPELTYAPQGKVSRGEFQSSTLFKHRIDRYKGEDLVEGLVDKTGIRFSELHAEYKTTTTDSKGRRRTQWHTIFKGLFFVADFNKHFHGRTVVLPDSAEKLFGRLGQKLQSWNVSRDDLVKLEDPEFEREFVVYATDQVEARYILSTALMRRILEFKRKMKVPVHIGFVNANLYMALSIKKNMFEPRVLRTILDFEMVREYLEDVMLAVGIVEEMNLNTRIWTKE
ncbi:MAG: DUF3137 domain-containing protein [Verrucomicrobia bacterium]|jgi:hypothetical protein|nr:DUF3137 domain-containing protein [Verrucomicrobiota bacterium]